MGTSLQGMFASRGSGMLTVRGEGKGQPSLILRVHTALDCPSSPFIFHPGRLAFGNV